MEQATSNTEIREVVQMAHKVLTDMVSIQTQLVDINKALALRIKNLEEHRDAHVNRIMVLESQLASVTEKFDAHLELYHV